MNWDDYDEYRLSNTIYEDAYIENWKFDENNKNILLPTNIIQAKEKCRIITESASNRYNLTQSIAETFGVFCRYIYEYDDSLHITNRTVEFYNNGVQEEKPIQDFTYYYDTESISRELDSAEQISKMYVLSSSNEDIITSSITEIDANKSLENYLLNFDYLLETGAIDEEQLEFIEKEFIPQIRDYNLQLRDLSKRISICSDAITKFQSIADTASVAAAEASEAMEDQYAHIKQLLTSVNQGTNNNSESFYKTGDNPDKVVVITATDESRSCKIRQEGVKPTSICVFESLADAQAGNNNKITQWRIITDPKTNFATGLSDISSSKEKNVLYLTYEYNPDLYHKTLAEQWKKKYEEETNKNQRYLAIIKKINGERDENGDLIDPTNGGIIKKLYERAKRS